MPLGKWHLIASESVPRVPSAGRSGRALQCCGKGYVWQLIVLDTDGNRLGKEGLDATGEGLWMVHGWAGGKERPLDLPLCGWRALLYATNASHVIAWPSFPCKNNTVLLWGKEVAGWLQIGQVWAYLSIKWNTENIDSFLQIASACFCAAAGLCLEEQGRFHSNYLCLVTQFAAVWIDTKIGPLDEIILLCCC